MARGTPARSLVTVTLQPHRASAVGGGARGGVDGSPGCSACPSPLDASLAFTGHCAPETRVPPDVHMPHPCAMSPWRCLGGVPVGGCAAPFCTSELRSRFAAEAVSLLSVILSLKGFGARVTYEASVSRSLGFPSLGAQPALEDAEGCLEIRCSFLTRMCS